MDRGATLGIFTQHEEQPTVGLELEGHLPAWLGGSLLRTVPALFEVGGRRISHWFDGLALLNAFAFADGQVTYTSRFLRSSAYEQARATGQMSRRGFANDPCGSIFRRFSSLLAPSAESLTDNGNVNIGRLGERFVALTEAPMPFEFDPVTLESIGLVDHDDAVGMGHGIPHPHYNDTGAMVNCVTTFGLRPRYRLYTVGPSSTRRHELASVATTHAAYMHSFAMSERYIALVEQPFVIDPVAIVGSGRPLRSFAEYLSWKPERGTRLHVFSRHTGKRVLSTATDPLFCFHTINSFDDADEMVIDLCAYDNPDIVGAFYLDELARPGGAFPVSSARRLRIDIRSGHVRTEQLSNLDIELPQINYPAFNARPYRFAYGVGRHENELTVLWNQLVKLDVERRTTMAWRQPNTIPSEPVFVAAPGAGDEDDGVVLSVVFDVEKEESFLLALDARSFEELARARAPQRIPPGFHGVHTDNLRFDHRTER